MLFPHWFARSVLVVLLALSCSQVASAGRVGAASRPRRGLGPLLVEPHDGFAPVYSFISSAKRTLELEMYELNDTTAERDLVADARRGVAVRVLLDKAYHGGSYDEAAFRYLSSHGVEVRWGPPDTIVHEKAIVVDDRRALVATFNLADTSDYYETTRDFGVLDAGRADVSAIAAVFRADWRGNAIARPSRADDGQDLLWSPGSEPALASVIAGARRTLLVESEEMSDDRIVAALAGAARRGVDVELVMTRSSYAARNLRELARAGVHVRTYAYDATPYIHAKVVVADPGGADRRLFLGSENFSYASLDHDRELGLVTGSDGLAQRVARTVREDFAHAR